MNWVGFISALAAVLAVLCGVPTASADTNTVPGWTVTKITAQGQPVETCVATWNNNGLKNEIAIEALGGLLSLTVSSPTFDQEKREEIVS